MQVRILPAASDQYRERWRGLHVRPLAVGRALATARGTDPCIGSSVGIESAGLRSLRTRVRVSPDALADVAQSGRRAAPRTLLLEVQILSSAFELAGMAQLGRRGGLKNRKLKVRILLPA